MSASLLLIVLLGLSALAYYLGRTKALRAAVGRGDGRLHSLPVYYGAYVALWVGLPALVVVVVWLLLEPQIIHLLLSARLPAEALGMDPARLSLLINDIKNHALGGITSTELSPELQGVADYFSSLRTAGLIGMSVFSLAAAAGGLMIGWRRISPAFRARHPVERALRIVLIVASTIAVLTTVGIVLSLLFESVRFFSQVSLFEFLFGVQWSPQTALRADQVGQTGTFGAVPIFAGTLMITLIAMLVAVPIGLFSAIYMAEYASPHFRSVIKPILEILAGIPTVVYGFFAALTVAPALRGFGEGIGLDVASESALAAGLVMGVMIIPFISSLSDDVINAVPQSLRDGSSAMGATKSETVIQVVLPAALPGIVGSVLLAVSRAIGETMIVVMAAGLSANLTANPFEAVTTVTVQIVTLLTGDQEFDSAKTLAAFALGLVLFIMTLGLNVIALRVVRRYREKYD
ncbi:MAG: phosphate ABC transporter permease subunit PstC [Alphaproteobacteria bacterium]|nr:phosphate ABC transporter permease subunit PstC [Alphaproteobacteria bacterium]